MSQLRQRQHEFEQLDVAVCIVTFDADWMAKAYVERTGITWPILRDADRRLYREYGMERGSLWVLYNPVTIFKYVKLLLAGQPLTWPGRDHRQLGGNVLVDPGGIVRLHHLSASPHDRPTVDRLLSVVRG